MNVLQAHSNLIETLAGELPGPLGNYPTPDEITARAEHCRRFAKAVSDYFENLVADLDSSTTRPLAFGEADVLCTLADFASNLTAIHEDAATDMQRKFAARARAMVAAAPPLSIHRW